MKTYNLNEDFMTHIFAKYFCDIDVLKNKELHDYFSQLDFDAVGLDYYDRSLTKTLSSSFWRLECGKYTQDQMENEIVKRLLSKTEDNLNCIIKAMACNYNPIHNYDKKETIEEKHTGKDEHKITLLKTQETPDINENEIMGFSSTDYSKDKKTTFSEGNKKDDTTDILNYGKVTTLTTTTQGNIGTTKTQEMIEDEINLRKNNEILNIIYNLFDRYIFIPIWES